MGSRGKFLRKGRGDFAQGINPWCKSSGAVRLEGSYQGSVKHHSADLAKCFCNELGTNVTGEPVKLLMTENMKQPQNKGGLRYCTEKGR